MHKYPLLIVAGLLTACAGAPESVPPGATSGIDTAGFDESVRPQDDFYRYVNGGWLAATEIPADRSEYGSFSILAEQSDAQLRQIVADVAALPADLESEARKIGTSTAVSWMWSGSTRSAVNRSTTSSRVYHE